MKILVDHGSSHNLGDTAMLEAVVERLLDRSDAVEAHVIKLPLMKTRLWENPRVRPAEFRFTSPMLGLGPFWRTPFLWRWSKAFVRPWKRYCFGALGRGLRPDGIRVDDGHSGEVSLAEWCRDYDGYLVVGGGNLTDRFPPEVWRRCCFIHAFADQGKPVVLSGQQVGPLESRVMRRAVSRALRRADFVGLREPTDSVDFCREARLSPDRFAVMGDDSFGVEPEDSARINAMLEHRGLSRGRFLAVNVRVANYSDVDQSHLREIAELFSALADWFEMPLLVVPIALNEADSDVRSGYRLAEAIGGDRVRVLDDSGLTPEAVKGVLGHAFGAVGVSYHFCTFALSQGVPAICIHQGDYYGQKGRGLCRLWGFDGLSMRIGDHDVEHSLRQVSEVFADCKHHDAIRERAEGLIGNWSRMIDERVLENVLLPASRCVSSR
jgi:polysaccharide pyruvyl transferase WcaK-like protein